MSGRFLIFLRILLTCHLPQPETRTHSEVVRKGRGAFHEMWVGVLESTHCHLKNT